MRRIPALLKSAFNTNEILTSLMLVYIAQLFLDWLIRGPGAIPQGFNFPESVSFPPEAVLPAIWEESGRAHWAFVFAIIAAILVWFMLKYTLKGFEIVVLGQSERAGRFAGFSSKKMIWFSFLFSGALAGLPASPRSPARSATCSRRSRRATASPRSSSPSSAASIRSASSLPASCWR
jgi:ABC-type uncharacterized transport system permease subunit